MSRPTFTGANGDGPGKKPCGWKDKCQKHKKDIDYPKKGILDRRPLIDWPHPSSGQNDANTTKIKDKHTRGKFTGQMVTAKNYRYQRHHVIPVEVFKVIKPMKENLILLGYNINVFKDNGVCLPFRPQDMMWHDLQCHRGSHPVYTENVLKRVEKIMGQCGRYCENGEQSTLWDQIEETVEECILEIYDWSLMIHPWSEGLRDDAKKLGWI